MYYIVPDLHHWLLHNWYSYSNRFLHIYQSPDPSRSAWHIGCNSVGVAEIRRDRVTHLHYKLQSLNRPILLYRDWSPYCSCIVSFASSCSCRPIRQDRLYIYPHIYASSQTAQSSSSDIWQTKS